MIEKRIQYLSSRIWICERALLQRSTHPEIPEESPLREQLAATTLFLNAMDIISLLTRTLSAARND